MMKKFTARQGFSLIELLVVISIIAVLIAIGLPNYLGARQRAKDVRAKADAAQLKNALRLYYNTYNKYPDPSVEGDMINGCGTTGTSTCPGSCSSGEFAAGGASGCDTVFMRKLPEDFTYYSLGGGDDFRLTFTLDNASDTDSTTSQERCGISSPVANEYVLCAD